MQGLKVPGRWLFCCGMGDQDKVFPVVRSTEYRHGTVVVVRLEDGREWTVIKELRGAEFVEVQS